MPEPQITICSPFPEAELPALFCWIQRVRAQVADDSSPSDLREWMIEHERLRESGPLETFGIYNGDHLGAYLAGVLSAGESLIEHIAPEIQCTIQAEIIFKAEVWGSIANAGPALNRGIDTLFESVGVESVFFPVFKHNKVLKRLLESCGGKSIGAIQPRVQNGVEVATEMYCFTATEWELRNREFVNSLEDAKNVNHVATVGG